MTTEITEDDLIEQIAAEREARKNGGEAPAPVPEPVAETPIDPPAETPVDVEPETTDEPFPGFAGLSEELRNRFLELDKRAKAAEELARERDKIRADYNAVHNRLAPTQRRLAELERQMQRPAPVQEKVLSKFQVEDWVKKQSPERQRYFKEFPEEARAAAEIAHEMAREMVSEEIGRVREETQSKLSEFERRSELAQLAAAHPDYNAYRLVRDQSGNWVPSSQQAADYWNWVNKQAPDVQRMADSNSAGDIAQVLSVYKWEKENPQYNETVALPEFQKWTQAVAPSLSNLAYSTDIRDRMYVLSQFWRDYEEANRGQDGGKAAEIKQKREQQAKQVAPSIRGTAAPAQAAARGDEDAVIEAVYQQMRARRRA